MPDESAYAFERDEAIQARVDDPWSDWHDDLIPVTTVGRIGGGKWQRHPKISRGTPPRGLDP